MLLYYLKTTKVQSSPTTNCSCKTKRGHACHHYRALLTVIPSCLWPDPNCPSLVHIIKCEPWCAVILPIIPPHQETKTRNKQRAGERIWSLCAIGMAALKPTEVEVKGIELAQWGLFHRKELHKLPLMTHLWMCLLTLCTVFPFWVC